MSVFGALRFISIGVIILVSLIFITSLVWSRYEKHNKNFRYC